MRNAEYAMRNAEYRYGMRETKSKNEIKADVDSNGLGWMEWRRRGTKDARDMQGNGNGERGRYRRRGRRGVLPKRRNRRKQRTNDKNNTTTRKGTRTRTTGDVRAAGDSALKRAAVVVAVVAGICQL